VVPKERSYLALENVAVLVLAMMPVHRRRQRARLHRMIDEGEPLSGVLAFDDKARAYSSN
jgi:hypothetical protein